MDLQSTQLGCFALADHVHGILFNGAGEQHPETADVFFVYFGNVAPQPVGAEVDPWKTFTHVVVCGACVETLLKQGDACFMPQSAAKNQGRIG